MPPAPPSPSPTEDDPPGPSFTRSPRTAQNQTHLRCAAPLSSSPPCDGSWAWPWLGWSGRVLAGRGRAAAAAAASSEQAGGMSKPEGRKAVCWLPLPCPYWCWLVLCVGLVSGHGHWMHEGRAWLTRIRCGPSPTPPLGPRRERKRRLQPRPSKRRPRGASSSEGDAGRSIDRPGYCGLI